MEQVERLIGKRELCEVLAISEATLYRWIRDHNFPAVKIGCRWKFKPSDVKKWSHLGLRTMALPRKKN